jgi:hypothetical protein
MSLSVNGETICEPEKNYIIGVQSIDYSPHYNFIEKGAPSYFSLFLTWLEQKTNCKFRVKALPIKRLNFDKNNIITLDFIYPDNAIWHDKNTVKRFYSLSLITAMTGMMVRPDKESTALEQFKTLAIVRGFTPAQWLFLAPNYTIKFHETHDALSALKMVLYKRADGADVEYNVAQYLLKKHHLNKLVLAKKLPDWTTTFHISSVQHPDIINKINRLIKKYPNEIQALKDKVNLIETNLEQLKK